MKDTIKSNRSGKVLKNVVASEWNCKAYQYFISVPSK